MVISNDKVSPAASRTNPSRRSGARMHRGEMSVGLPGAPAARRTAPCDDDNLHAILDLLPFAVLCADRHKAILHANPAAAALFGYPLQVLNGTPAGALLPRWASDTDGETVARRMDGTEFSVRLSVARPSEGTACDYLMTVTDLTVQQELDGNRCALVHLSRVSTLGQLAGSLAHELNQPLTAILSNVQAAQRLIDMAPDLDALREILDDLVKDNRRASEVLRKIRLLVRPGDRETEPVDLPDLIDDVVLLLHSDAIVRGIRLSVNVAARLPPVSGDKVQLQQVVLNLVLNAFEALAPRPSPERMVTIEAMMADEGTVRITVRDRGCGFTSDTLPRLFKPYVTSKREGLGLGLYISRSIVELHGGHIWVEQNQGQGAAIHFTLPAIMRGRRRSASRT
ncbi:sensor histidine kinase [Bordetella genomosp. 8]|nr:ATP-binding protein [Bordetella genomosp. 8]